MKNEILIQENQGSPEERYTKRAWGSPERESKFKANFSKLDAKLGCKNQEDKA